MIYIYKTFNLKNACLKISLSLYRRVYTVDQIIADLYTEKMDG